MSELYTEAVETCPFCEGENVYSNWDVQEQGYIARCQHCGEKIMLCDECLHADDNKGRACDWHGHCEPGKWSEGKCFRGATRRVIVQGAKQ